MRVLITGGAGFIGSRLAGRLLGSDAEVTVFDSLHPQVHGRVTPSADPRLALHAADVADAAAWDRFFRTHDAPDVVVHLAAETGTGQSLNEAARHGLANVVGTTQMTDAFVRHECRPAHVVLTSSRAVYGEGAWVADGQVYYPAARGPEQLAAGVWDPPAPSGAPGEPLPHRAGATIAAPTNVYAATKLAQEHLLQAWCGAHEVPLSVLRLQNVYGPGQAVGNSYTGVLTFFARQLAAGEPINVYEDGRIVRDFVFVDDVVAAIERAVAVPPERSRTVDIGCGRPVHLHEVASTMAALAGAEEPIVSGAYRLGDVRAASADITAASADLGWSPAVSLTDGLGALLSWVPTQL